jgi:cupin 2 domain-containing protein
VSGSIFAGLPRSTVENEQFSELLGRPGLRIERIVSTGHRSPPGFWYDQPGGEWVLLIDGAARLRFADEPASRELAPGDFVDIAPTAGTASSGPHPTGRPSGWRSITPDEPAAAVLRRRRSTGDLRRRLA